MDMDGIDPDLRRFVTQMRRDWQLYPPLDSLPFPEQRAVAEKVRAAWVEGGPQMAATETFEMDPGAGPLRIRIYRPAKAATAQPAMVYLHGGGFTLFSIDTHDRLMREYAAAGGFVVVGVDYPLAPEAKFPIALDRIEALMRWLGQHAGQWGIDPARIAMGGDSAGGNFSIATCLRLRDRGEDWLVKAILSNYGGFTTAISDAAEARFGGPGSIMDRAEARQYWANYLRDEADTENPHACPLLADLHSLPPTLLIVPEMDIVAEQSLLMHQKLLRAGVKADCTLYPGAIHSFLEAMSISPLARQAIREGADFIARHIRAEPKR